MRCKPMLAFFAVVLCYTAVAHAQQWSGIIDPSRAIDWTGAGVTGGIPNRTTICATYNPGTSASTINTAITNCSNAGGGVVYLNAGTYNLSAGLSLKNNVTLRGAGADATLLVISGNAGCGYTAGICLGPSTIPSPGDEKNVCDWTAGYARGTTSITLANCGSTTPALGALTNLKVGSLITLDQVDEAADNGTIWNCAVMNVCGNTTPGGGQRTNGPSVGGISNRSQQQTVTVTACGAKTTVGQSCAASDTTLTIAPGLYMPNWRSGQAPQAWFGSSYLSSAGLEDLSLDGSNVSAAYNIAVVGCVRCWVKGVRSMWAGRNHVLLAMTQHSEVRDNYFYQNRDHASQSYGVELFWAAADNLVENNIAQQITDSLPNCNGSCTGNVFAYNFGIDMVWVSSGWMQATFYQHAAGDSFNLLEGNFGTGFTADQVHGTHHFETAFRNRLTGWQSTCGGAACTMQTIPVHLYAGSRYFNIVGNVLGQTGYHTNYTCTGGATDPGTGNHSIYALGASGNECKPYASLSSYCLTPACTTHGDYDPQVTSYLLRWGNWDTVNNTVRWQSSEVPSGISPYGNAAPPSQTLPASFYRSAKPAWFGSVAWPPIGPDVSGGNIANTGGHANMNPAMACYTNVMGGPADGGGSALTFNAASCYGQSGGSVRPNAPLNLKAP